MVYNREHRNSAFESYKKPTSPTDSKHASVEGEENDDPSPARLVASGKERNKNVDSYLLLCNIFSQECGLLSSIM